MSHAEISSGYLEDDLSFPENLFVKRKSSRFDSCVCSMCQLQPIAQFLQTIVVIRNFEYATLFCTVPIHLLP